jgi:poly(hydroxyalkanoate) depolymerase family esterase
MLLAALLCSLLVATTPGDGTSTRRTYPAGNHSRDYVVYQPPGMTPGAPLVVYLHGCSQDADDVAIGTRWNQLADAEGFAVVYPEQTTTPNQAQGNGIGCWNWFRPDHQGRDQGEPATIAGITRLVADELHSDPRRIFVLGASAGADMAVVLGATYPDLYAAIGSLAGCPYRSCTDATGADAYAAMGALARRMPALIVQGNRDTTNPLPASIALLHQWLGTNDLIDDGLPNGSVSRLPASSASYAVAEGNGYAYTRDRYADADGCDLLDLYVVDGLGHAYPNGDPAGSFTDSRGPDITRIAYEFLLAHPMPTGGAATACGGDPVNSDPTARADVAAGAEDSQITVSVLANDEDPDGDPLSVALETVPTHGDATVTTEGDIAYLPHRDYHGVDAFSYRIDDGRGGSATADVTITVSPTDDTTQCDDQEVTRAGDWRTSIDPRATYGTYCQVTGNSAGVFVEVGFTGATVDLVHAVSGRGGSMRAWIDGTVAVEKIDLYEQGASGANSLAFGRRVTIDAGGWGHHVLRLEVTNTDPSRNRVHIEGLIW